jgi:hypothetical protein
MQMIKKGQIESEEVEGLSAAKPPDAYGWACRGRMYDITSERHESL